MDQFVGEFQKIPDEKSARPVSTALARRVEFSGVVGVLHVLGTFAIARFFARWRISR